MTGTDACQSVPAQILESIASDFRRALIAEQEFVLWQGSNKNASLDEFAEQFTRWVDTCEPYVRSYHLIEDRYPAFSGKMHETLRLIERELLGSPHEPA